MKPFVVSALKYRPQSFADVVGQKAITDTLENAIKTDHLAQALLFTGPRGVGKTTCARILAKMINTTEDTGENEDFAFNIFELDAASNNSVDDIRSITDQVRIPPQTGRFKVYIIDEVHMLSQAAFNAFLKTLEEPPPHCIFILATTEKHKIIPTILSRCQIFDFRRISISDMIQHLKKVATDQEVYSEDAALHIIAQKAEGALRDALSIFDRVVSFTQGKLSQEAVSRNLNVLDFDTYLTCTQLILEHQIPELILQYHQILDNGFDGLHFVSGLANHFRNLMMCNTPKTSHLLEIGPELEGKYQAQAQQTGSSFLIQALEITNQCSLDYKNSHHKRLLVELCLMQLASIGFEPEKKKNKPKIIPARHFQTTTPQKEPTTTSSIPTTQEDVSPQKKPKNNLITPPSTDVEKPKIPDSEIPIQSSKPSKRVSGFSLKSIQEKKDFEKKISGQVEMAENLPTEKVTHEDLISHWKNYINRLHKSGEKILASILEMNPPKLENTSLILTFPNESLKIELEQKQGQILSYLRKKLQNYDLHFKIIIDEKEEKKYVYTAQEKYNRMIEKNPALEELKNTFGLDV